MKKLITFFYIDALNSSFLNSSTMPFLSELAKKHYYQALENVVGYSFAIQSSMLSGKFPEESGSWMPYFYSPENSPTLFKAMGKVGSTFKLDKLPLIRYFIMWQIRRFFLKKGVHTDNIPLSMINEIGIYPYYYMCELPAFYKLKQLLYEKYQTVFTYIGPPKIKSLIYGPLLEYIQSSHNEKEFILAYDDRLDMLGHEFGPNSTECLSYAKYLDSNLYNVYKKLKNRFNHNFTFIIFSDHGQSELKFQINILSLIDNEGLKLGVDYICFVDATMVLFWPRNKKAKKKILNMLSKIGQGVIIDEDRIKKYHVEFKDNRYGEIIFVLKPGGTFFPNFFSPLGVMKGLHGYLPEEDVQKAFFISNTNFSHHFKHVKDFRKLVMNISSW